MSGLTYAKYQNAAKEAMEALAASLGRRISTWAQTVNADPSHVCLELIRRSVMILRGAVGSDPDDVLQLANHAWQYTQERNFPLGTPRPPSNLTQPLARLTGEVIEGMFAEAREAVGDSVEDIIGEWVLAENLGHLRRIGDNIAVVSKTDQIALVAMSEQLMAAFLTDLIGVPVSNFVAFHFTAMSLLDTAVSSAN
jgi:hypothetical protein